MPECQNCGSYVSETYAEVYTENGGNPLSCANCEETVEAENPSVN